VVYKGCIALTVTTSCYIMPFTKQHAPLAASQL